MTQVFHSPSNRIRILRLPVAIFFLLFWGLLGSSVPAAESIVLDDEGRKADASPGHYILPNRTEKERIAHAQFESVKRQNTETWIDKLDPQLIRYVQSEPEQDFFFSSQKEHDGAYIHFLSLRGKEHGARLLRELSVTTDYTSAEAMYLKVSGLNSDAIKKIAELKHVRSIESVPRLLPQLSKAVGILGIDDTKAGNSGATPQSVQKVSPVPIAVIDVGFWKDQGFVFDKPEAIFAPRGHLQSWSKATKDSFLKRIGNFGADHGTVVTGIINGGAYPGLYAPGFAPMSGVQESSALYLCDRKLENEDYCFSYLRTIMKTPKPEFVNLSSGCRGGKCGSSGGETGTYRIDKLVWDSKMLVVAAAGNEGQNRIGYEELKTEGELTESFEEWANANTTCGAKNALCVGAVTNAHSPRFWRNSNDAPTSDGRVKPDVYAIGDYESFCFPLTLKSDKKPNIRETCRHAGTSLAAPMVTATLAIAAAENKSWRGKPHVAKAWAILSAVRTDELSETTVGAIGGRTGWLQYYGAEPVVTSVADITDGDGTPEGENASFVYVLPKKSKKRNRIHGVLTFIEKEFGGGQGFWGCNESTSHLASCRYVANEIHIQVKGKNGAVIKSSVDDSIDMNSPARRDTVRHVSFCLHSNLILENNTVMVEMVAHDVPDVKEYPYKWAMGLSADYHESCEE